MLDIHAFTNFDSAARKVLAFLRARIGFDLWMVTRTEDEDWIVLQADDRGYGIEEGTVFHWADTFCAKMVNGDGPRIAPHSNAVLAYANAPIAERVAIGAYVGVPLVYSDGALFGTLCAIHPTPQPEAIAAELPLIELLATLLSNLLNADLKASEQMRSAEQAQARAASDALTGLYNRRGWDELLAQEEKRCRQYGHPACAIVIDLDGLKQVNDTLGHAKGDELIVKAGHAIRKAVRKEDVVARLGGDEFGVLCIESNLVSGKALVERIQASLASVQVEASLGIAARQPGGGLLQAWEEADRAMYVRKTSRKKR